MDLCGVIFVFCLVVFIITLIGHGLWVLFGTIISFLTNSGERRELPLGSVRCPGCDTKFSRREPECPCCGLDPFGLVANELRELNAAATAIEDLMDSGALANDLGEQVCRGIESRRTLLLEGVGRGSGVRRGEIDKETPTPRERLELGPVEPILSVIPVLSVEQSASVEKEEPASAGIAVPATRPQEMEVRRRPPAPAPEPRRSMGQMLGGFMEEKNILWGELVGGLLIVGCSIALVISLWRPLEQIPYFPFLGFVAITAAMFAAGLYTLGHWKLETTSRGLLVISTLMIPLDFLVLAGLTAGQESGPLDWGTEIVSLVIFTAMVVCSGKILVRPALSVGFWKADWLLAAGVVGASASQVLVPRWLDIHQNVPWVFALLGPVLVQTLAVGIVLVGLNRRERLEVQAANVLFLFVGLVLFAVAVALGFIVYWSEDDLLRTLRYLAVPIAAAALPLCVAGALVQRKLQDSPAQSESVVHGLSSGMIRLTGTIMALVGMGVMLGAMLLAWPRPVALIVVSGLNVAVFFGLALRFRVAYLHVPALICLAIGWVTAFFSMRGELAGDATAGSTLLSLAGSPECGSALTALALLLVGTGEWLFRTGRRLDAIHHLAGSGVVMACALLLVGLAGADVPGRGAIVFAIAGLGGLLVNGRWRQITLTAAASFAFLGSIVYVLLWIESDLSLERLWLLALLTHASLAVLASLAVTRSALLAAVTEGREGMASYALPLRDSGVFTSFVAAAVLCLNVDWTSLPACCGFTTWLAAVWLVLAWSEVWPAMFAAFQAALAVAVLFGITGWLHGQDWFADRPSRLFHLWSLQPYSLGLAVLSLSWVAICRCVHAQCRAQALLEPGWRTVDWGILVLTVVGQFALAAYALWPELVHEIVPVAWQADFLPFEVYGPFAAGTAWAMLGILALTLLIALRDRRPQESVIGLLLLALTVPIVFAHVFGAELAAASALRWGLAGCFLVCSVLLWDRARLLTIAVRLGVRWQQTWDVAKACRAMLIVFGLTPALLLSAWVALLGLTGQQLPGPMAESFFAHIGWIASLALPLGVIAVGLTGHGVRENSAGYIFSAGLVVLAIVMGGYALTLETAGGFSVAEGVFCVQLGVITAAAWALAWLATGRWRESPMLGLQVLLGMVGNFPLLALALMAVLIPLGSSVPNEFEEKGMPALCIGMPAGWIGLLTTLAAGVWQLRLVRSPHVMHVLAGGGIAVVVLAAIAMAGADSTGWLSYHMFNMGLALVAFGILTAGWAGSALPALGPLSWPAERRVRMASLLRELFPASAVRSWLHVLVGCIAILAFGVWNDPDRPYWSCAALLVNSVLAGATAVWARKPSYVYVSGGLINLTGFLIWATIAFDWRFDLFVIFQVLCLTLFVILQVICLALSSTAWSLVELGLRQREQPVDLRAGKVPFTHVAAWLAVVSASFVVLSGVVGDLSELEVQTGGSLTWLALAFTSIALVVCFWDPEAGVGGLPAAPLYILGLLVLGLTLHDLSLSPRELAWTSALTLGGYIFAVAGLVRLGPRLAPFWHRFGMPPRPEGWMTRWLVPAQTLVALLVLGLSLWICLDFPSVFERLAGPLAVSLVAGAGLAMASLWPTVIVMIRLRSVAIHDRSLPCLVTLCLAVLAAVEASWAVLDPEFPAPWLHRNVLTLTVLVLLAGVYGYVLRHWLGQENEWVSCARRLTPFVSCLAGLALALVLVQEFALYDGRQEVRRTPMVWPAVALVAVLLAGVLSAGVWIAVSRRHDPFGLTDRGRVRCVWAAEIIFVLFWVHLRLNIPDLFTGFVGKNWPLVLMALAFLGVGLAELCARRGLPMLAEPLQLTGLFLPLLPLLAYLVRPLAELHDLGEAVPGLQPIVRYLDRLPRDYGMHAFLWFLVGMLYALVAVTRRASGFALLAALCANFGLWVILANREGLAFLLHPQLWLIPLGLTVLAAEHINRSRLTTPQSQTVRYVGLLLIYLSSTADMFITGLGESVWLPLALAVFAIVGVLAGILLRVRAFLFLGVSFLFLVIFAQIWYAAVNRSQTWVWWASGIVLGAAILTLFALFEKRRNDVLKVIEDIKQWK